MNKICRVCKDLKNLKDFHKKCGTSDGYRGECKECVKELQKKYKEASGFKEKQKMYLKEYYFINREAIREYTKKENDDNRDNIL